MEKFKGTPWPWYVITNSIWTGDNRMKENNGCIIAECHGSDKNANLKLIAAAPDLLEACQAALIELELYIPITNVQVLDKIQAAINKALG